MMMIMTMMMMMTMMNENNDDSTVNEYRLTKMITWWRQAYFDIEDIDVSANRFAIDIDIDFGGYFKRIPASCVYDRF